MHHRLQLNQVLRVYQQMAKERWMIWRESHRCWEDTQGLKISNVRKIKPEGPASKVLHCQDNPILEYPESATVVQFIFLEFKKSNNYQEKSRRLVWLLFRSLKQTMHNSKKMVKIFLIVWGIMDQWEVSVRLRNFLLMYSRWHKATKLPSLIIAFTIKTRQSIIHKILLWTGEGQKLYKKVYPHNLSHAS